MAIANHSQFIAFRNSSRFSEWRPQFIAFHNRVAIAAFHRVATAIHCVSAFNSELRPQFIAFHRFFDRSLARSRDSLRLAFFDRSLATLSHLFDIVNILRRMVFFRKLTEAGSGDARQGRRPALPAPRSRADRWQYTTALCVASAHSRRHSTLETRPPPPRPSPPPPSPHQCVALYDVQDAHGDDALMSLLASHAMRSALAPSSTAMRRARAL